MIMGINAYTHDASATIVNERGKILAAVEEERFTRKKREPGFPVESIWYCLGVAGVRLEDIAVVGFPRDPTFLLRKKLYSNLFVEPVGINDWEADIRYLWKILTTRRRLGQYFPNQGSYPRVAFINHHLAHAASAFYGSPFQDAAYLTADGIGEWECATWGIGSGHRLHRLGGIDYPHSIGMVYSAIARFLGLMGGERSGKLMGLAGWGRPLYADVLWGIVRPVRDGEYRLDYRYFDFHRKPRVSERFQSEFGFAFRTPFEELFVQPAAHDAGPSLGCAYYLLHHVDESCRRHEITTAALGPEFSDSEIEAAVNASDDKDVRAYATNDPALEAARMLARGQVIAWFQGRMEFGPRALGCRSLLADPRPAGMRDHVNRLKGREWFRPLAPSIMIEYMKDWFEDVNESPFMLRVSNCKAANRHLVPSIVHVDGSARVQTVSRMEDPLFHRLLQSFYELTGIPMVLNTSFQREPTADCMHAARCGRAVFES